MERLIEFLPSVFVLLTVAIMGFLYKKLVMKPLKSEFEAHWSDKDWIEKNSPRHAIPSLVESGLVTPVFEELIFRVPIVIAFSSLTMGAWLGILVSSIVSAMTLLFFRESKKRVARLATSAPSEAVSKTIQRSWTFRPIGVAIRFIFGIGIGYFGVKYQSLWLCVGIAIGSRLVASLLPILMMIIAVIAYMAVALLRWPIDALRSWWRMRKFLRQLRRMSEIRQSSAMRN